VAQIALSYVLTQPIAAPNLAERYEEAEKLARRAVELAPSNPLALDQLGVTLELRGQIGPDTESYYRRAIRIDPSLAPPYAHLGRLLRRRGLTKESAAAYQDAVQRSSDVGTMILVAEVMQSEQRYVESENLLRSALNSDPRNPSALLLLGRALTARGEFADAEKLFKRSLEVSPNGFRPNLMLASLYWRKGENELAENALLQAMRTVPNSEKRLLAQQFELVGDAYLKTGKRQKAERSYQRAKSLDPENDSLSAKLARTNGG
jgi:tetratricopeptide (TPR) repeat protein